MKKFLFVFIYFFSFYLLSAQDLTFNFNILKEFGFWNGYKYIIEEIGGYYYLNVKYNNIGAKAIRISAENLIPEIIEPSWIYGIYNNKLYVDFNDDYEKKYLIDPITGTKMRSPFNFNSYIFQYSSESIISYEGQFDSLHPYMIEAHTGKFRAFTESGSPAALSNDRRYMIISQYGYNTALYSFHEKKIVVTMTIKTNVDVDLGLEYPHYFINNNLIISPEPASSSWIIWNTQGKILYRLKFTFDKMNIGHLGFMNNFTRAIVNKKDYDDSFETYAIDTRPFYNWLVENKYLFLPKVGIITDDNLRIREYPSVEAPVLGQLMNGTRVEVVDQSGFTTQVGNINTYWYQIKTKDSIIGWVFGGFLKIE